MRYHLSAQRPLIREQFLKFVKQSGVVSKIRHKQFEIIWRVNSKLPRVGEPFEPANTYESKSNSAHTFETSTSREFRDFSHTFNVVLLMKFGCWPSWLVCLAAAWPASPLCMLKCRYDMYSGGIGCCSLLTASRCFLTLR